MLLVSDSQIHTCLGSSDRSPCRGSESRYSHLDAGGQGHTEAGEYILLRHLARHRLQGSKRNLCKCHAGAQGYPYADVREPCGKHPQRDSQLSIYIYCRSGCDRSRHRDLDLLDCRRNLHVPADETQGASEIARGQETGQGPAEGDGQNLASCAGHQLHQLHGPHCVCGSSLLLGNDGLCRTRHSIVSGNHLLSAGLRPQKRDIHSHRDIGRRG